MRIITNKRLFMFVILAVVYLFYSLAFASGGDTASDSADGHGGPVLNVLLQLIVILLAAKLGGDLFERVKQPAVLGELVIGMILGNLHLVGLDLFSTFQMTF